MSLVPKIKIEITLEELNEVCETFTKLPESVYNEKESKVFRSVIDTVVTKLFKKQLSKRYTSKFNLSLEFFEAHYLETWLIYCNVPVTSASQRVISKLNQKLG